MINKKFNNNLKLALQHNLKCIKIKKKNTPKLLIKNYSLYIYKNKLILNSFINKKFLNV